MTGSKKWNIWLFNSGWTKILIPRIWNAKNAIIKFFTEYRASVVNQIKKIKNILMKFISRTVGAVQIVCNVYIHLLHIKIENKKYM